MTFVFYFDWLIIRDFYVNLQCQSLAEPTNEARAETQARLGYALQGGGRAEGSTAHEWVEAGKTQIHKRRNCTLWF